MPTSFKLDTSCFKKSLFLINLMSPSGGSGADHPAIVSSARLFLLQSSLQSCRRRYTTCAAFTSCFMFISTLKHVGYSLFSPLVSPQERVTGSYYTITARVETNLCSSSGAQVEINEGVKVNGEVEIPAVGCNYTFTTYWTLKSWSQQREALITGGFVINKLSTVSLPTMSFRLAVIADAALTDVYLINIFFSFFTEAVSSYICRWRDGEFPLSVSLHLRTAPPRSQNINRVSAEIQLPAVYQMDDQ